MSIRDELPHERPTDPKIFMCRRSFLAKLGLGTIAAGAGGIALVEAQRRGKLDTMKAVDGAASLLENPIKVPFQRPDVFPAVRNPGFEPSRAITTRLKAARQNNFYEFIGGQAGPVFKYVDDFKVTPWAVEVTGECAKPRTFDLDDLFRLEHEERVYRFRCVETWAMVVPWTGFQLSKLLALVEPTSHAKYVRFTSANRPKEMPGMRQSGWYPWPYFEGLRMDEAMNELAMVVTGVYGEPLLKQHGSPVRIICPWKYGYKNPKSIVKIELLREQPETFWHQSEPNEYGFFSNVNPNSPHPRWSQATETLLDDPDTRIDTAIFNGYGEFVAQMYPDEPRELLKKAISPPL